MIPGFLRYLFAGQGAAVGVRKRSAGLRSRVWSERASIWFPLPMMIPL